MLSYIFSGRGGLQNTSFALLDPDGKKLTRGSRSPSMTYGSAEKFVDALLTTAKKYETDAKPIEALPTLVDLRRALNVAAADLRPLVIVRGKDREEAGALAARVAKSAWAEQGVGTARYVVLSEEATFEGLTPPLGVSVVQPDPFGRGGKVLAKAPVDAKDAGLVAAIAKGIAAHEAEDKEHDDHVRSGRRQGIGWETEVPVTDGKSERRTRRK